MSKAADKSKAELPMEAMLLECNKDRYKLAYAAIRWAKEIKQKENLPEGVQFLVPRALREILGGKVSIKDVEKLPMITRVSTPPPVSVPTITLNVVPEDKVPSKEEA